MSDLIAVVLCCSTMFPGVPLYGAYSNNPYGFTALPDDRKNPDATGSTQTEAGDAQSESEAVSKPISGEENQTEAVSLEDEVEVEEVRHVTPTEHVTEDNEKEAESESSAVIGWGENEAGATLPELHGDVTCNNPAPLRTVYTFLALS